MTRGSTTARSMHLESRRGAEKGLAEGNSELSRSNAASVCEQVAKGDTRDDDRGTDFMRGGAQEPVERFFGFSGKRATPTAPPPSPFNAKRTGY